ncbi:hypothetical protein B5M09_003698 [Aphanomyces astaci]|uniref:Exoribonuclease phosphorolytic domain-containing protein n=2 Tax=Aphanomyces astaci TaxID=112090 RepID=A0A425CV49_APHAT|nr:hypothetical protein B5M09_003698 [Aphanomyces astaci]
MARLYSLDVSFNELKVLENLHTAKDLKELKAYNNKLTSSAALEVLMLSDNAIAEISSDFTALFKLKTLHLHGNTITRIDNLKTCRHLTYLDLSRNRIAGAWSNALQSLAALEYVNVSDNQITSIGSLENLKKLEEINLGGNLLSSLSGNYPPNLTTLRVDRNKFADLSTLPLLPNLNEFYAQGNLLTDIAAVVSRMPQVAKMLSPAEVEKAQNDVRDRLHKLRHLMGKMCGPDKAAPSKGAAEVHRHTVTSSQRKTKTVGDTMHVRPLVVPADAEITTDESEGIAFINQDTDQRVETRPRDDNVVVTKVEENRKTLSQARGQAKTSDMGTDPLDGIPIRPPTSHGSTREGEIQTTEGGSTSFVTMLQVDDEKDDKGLGVRDMVVEPSALERSGTSYEDAMKLHLASALKAEDIEVDVGGEWMKDTLGEELPRRGIGRFRLMSTKEPSMTPAKKHPAVAVVAGAIAGGIEMCSIWPMEMIKTNLQLGTMKSHYTKMLPGFRYHIQTGGVLSLYRGLAPVLVGSLPKAGLRFGAFDSIKQLLADEHGQSTPLRNLAAGMSAGAIEAILVTTPTETVKTKLIDANAGMLHGIKRILETDGIRGLYQGLTATIMKQATNTGLRFMWFSEYKARVPDLLARNGVNYDTLSPGELAIVSFVGGMTAAFDVVKTKMQGLEGARYPNTWDCAMTILKRDGVAGFYAGVVPRLGRVIPGQGIIFMSYDTISMHVAKYLDDGTNKVTVNLSGVQSKEIRPLSCEQGLLNRADGSARFSHGSTSVVASVNGPAAAKNRRQEKVDAATLEVVFKSDKGAPTARDKEYEVILRQTFETVVYLENFPRAVISLTVQVVEDDGSLLAVAINAVNLALLDAGIPMRSLVGAITCSILDDGQLCLDPSLTEGDVSCPAI